MVDRIRQLIQARQLSPTQFADAIGVARPIVSHILGGRNKPSLEVVQKIIAAFPDIALPWLLSGQGDMLSTPSTAPVASEPAPAALEAAAPRSSTRRVPRKAEEPVKASETLRPLPRPVAPADETVAVEPAPAAAVGQPMPVPAAAQPQAVSVPATPGPDPTIAPFLAHATKSIRRVLIFYNDGTFADFSPAQDAF